MKVRVLGKVWDLVLCPFLRLHGHRGDVDRPDLPGKKIRLYSGLTGEEALEVAIHELLHAADWSKDEEWVQEAGEDIARALWALGWRRG